MNDRDRDDELMKSSLLKPRLQNIKVSLKRRFVIIQVFCNFDSLSKHSSMFMSQYRVIEDTILPFSSNLRSALTEISKGFSKTLRVFGLERIERERRDLVDFEGLAWGGVLPSGGF